MPVTFQTDLRDLKDFEYVPQLPLEALFKNLAYKQAKYDQGFQQAQSIREGLNIKAYGQDAARKEELLKQIDEESKKFAGADFSDKKVLAEYTNWLNGIASSPEFVGMRQRADWYEKNQRKLEKLTQNGEDIPDEDKQALVQAENYFSGNEPYSPNKRFVGEVYKPYDFSKLGEDVFKTVSEEKDVETGQTWIEYDEGKKYNNLYSAMKSAVENDAVALNALRRKFEHRVSGVDYAAMNLGELTNSAAAAQKRKETAEVLYRSASTESDREKARAEYQQAELDLQHLTNLAESNDPASRKAADWSDFLNDYLHKYAMNRMYHSKTNVQENPYTQNVQQSNLRVKEKALGNLIDAGELGVAGDFAKGVSGISLSPMIDASGNAISGGLSAAKQSKIQTGSGELDYSSTVTGLQDNDPTIMKVVFGHTVSKFPELQHIISYDVNPQNPSELVVQYFPNQEAKDDYYESRNPATRKPPLVRKITSSELLKALGLSPTKVGQGIQKATQQTPSNSTQNTTNINVG